MSNMTKYVRIKTQVAVRNVNPPICGTYEGIMTTGDILKCICKRAIVHEILPDGKTVRLNMSNYYIDNGAGLNAEVHHPVEKKVIENPGRFKVPDVPKTSVVETKTDNADSNDSVNVADLNMPATEEVVNAVPENDTVVNETTPVSESETVEAADTSNTEESVETTENSNAEETESVEETADTSNTETATSQNNHNNYQYYNKKNKKNR